MQRPSYLKKGDQIRILSTARKISESELNPAINLIERWGLKVSLGKYLFAESDQFAGTTQERTEDLQEALDDPNIQAILCARGGYGSVKLIDQINFENFRNHPKWVVGYSDVTVLHNHINKNYDIQTLHATMPINFPEDGNENQSTRSLKSALFGEKLSYNFNPKGFSKLDFEEIIGQLMGGNLSIIYSLTGTSSQLDLQDSILFLEDLDEYLYHIDRMMMNLKRAGIFKGCKAVLIGGMSDMNDNAIPYGKTAEEIICDILSDLNIPLIFGFPAGHLEPNFALPMGGMAKLIHSDSQITLSFDGTA